MYPDPVAVTETLELPAAAVDALFTVSTVEEPTVSVVGANCPVTPCGSPLAEIVSGPENVPLCSAQVTVALTVFPRTTLNEAGLAASLHAAGFAIVSVETRVLEKPVFVLAPMVSGYVPGVVVLSTVSVITVLGFAIVFDPTKALTPFGLLPIQTVTGFENPESAVTTAVNCAVEPGSAVTVAGFSESLNTGTEIAA